VLSQNSTAEMRKSGSFESDSYVQLLSNPVDQSRKAAEAVPRYERRFQSLDNHLVRIQPHYGFESLTTCWYPPRIHKGNLVPFLT
jgi:hypothetical protein